MRERERKKKINFLVVYVIIYLFFGGWIKDFLFYNEICVERKI